MNFELFQPEYGSDEGLTGVDAVLCLLEVIRLRVGVDVDVDLVDARQRVQHTAVGLRVLQHGVAQHVGVLHLLVFLRVGEALALDAGHVDDVGVGHAIPEFGVLVVFVVAVLDVLLHLARQLQLDGRDEVELRVEVAHGLDEAVDGAAVFQVADEGDFKVLECALRLADAVEVEHALGGVLVGTVARVDDRHLRHLGGETCRAFNGVTHDDEVGVAGHHGDGVGEGFALLDARSGSAAEADDVAAQELDGRLEAQTRTGGRLEEERGDDAPVQQVLVRVFLEVLGDVEDMADFFRRVVADGNQAAVFQ